MSETPDKNSDDTFNSGTHEIEQTVIMASDDEDVEDHDSPSVIIEETDEMRGCGQTIEPTLLLSGSMSDEVDGVGDAGGGKGGDTGE